MSAIVLAASAVVAWAQTAPAVDALPQGAQVAAGQVEISRSGNQLNVQQGSAKAIINWQSFDIGKNAAVQFHQPDANSVALNRVQTGAASQIFGKLIANGQVFLLNANGVLFAPDAQVDVGALVAGAMKITDEDFLAGRMQFTDGEGVVTNKGTITAREAGYIALLAPEVRNEGIIRAQRGTVVLAAGRAITLRNAASGLTVVVDQGAIEALIENRHLVSADDGTVFMSARAASALQQAVINNSGTVSARSAVNAGGKIRLSADVVRNAGNIDASGSSRGGDIEVAAREFSNTGSIVANGDEGGRVAIAANRVLRNEGLIAARGLNGAGGKVTLASAEILAQVSSGLVSVASHGVGAPAGRIELRAAQLELQGALNAAADRGAGGNIDLIAAQATLEGARLDASGDTVGGSIDLRGLKASDARALLTAGVAVDAAPEQPWPLPDTPLPPQKAILRGSTLNSSSRRGRGGSVILTSDEISLIDHTRVDVTGDSGGGRALIGGDWEGQGQVPQATRTYIDSTVRIDVSAISDGNGGTIVAWSDIRKTNGLTTVSGQLLAKGGAKSGDGGRIETSGYLLNIDTIRVSTQAPLGKTGEWLLDPYDISISNASASGVTNASGTFTPGSNSAVVNITALQTALISSNVTVTTGSSGTQTGDITVVNALTNNTANSLTLKAAGSIFINADVTSSGTGALILLAGSGTVSGTGTLIMGSASNTTGATLQIARGTTLSTDIRLNGRTTIGFAPLEVEYLIVGGGGGGGGDNGGGGGGGGLRTGTTLVATNSVAVSVGAGGAGGTADIKGRSGSNSEFNGIVALGGGGGAGGGPTTEAAQLGGSGGGGDGERNFTGAAGTAGQGFRGGNGFSGDGGGGGGGGAGGVGSNATSTAGGAGGIGALSDITGASVRYAGGGGGGPGNGSNLSSVGGQGGGGNGGLGTGAAGTNQLGGGGGGAGWNGSIANGGAGGSGVVIVRYRSDTTLAAGGSVTAGTGSASGYQIHTFAASGTFTIDTSSLTATLTGVISGTNALTLAPDGGTLTLTGNNTYSGTTTINAGVVNVGGAGTTGSLGLGAIVNSGTLQYDRTDVWTVTNVISGTGSLTKLGSGVLTLSAAQTYTGATNVSAGTLRVTGSLADTTAVTVSSGATYGVALTDTVGSITGAGDITLEAGVTLSAGGSIGAGASIEFAGNISGDGAFKKLGAGTLTLSGTNTYTGGTTNDDGFLLGDSDSLQGSIVNNFIVRFVQTGEGTFAGTMSGPGVLEKSGAGTLILASANSHSGGVTVREGTLVVTADGALGNPAGANQGIIYGTGANVVNGRDQNWKMVAVPTGYTPPEALPYNAYAISGTSFNYTQGGVTYLPIAPRNNIAAIVSPTYTWIVAQTFKVIRDGTYTFSFTGKGDDYVSFYIDGTVTNANTKTPGITGGTLIGQNTTYNQLKTMTGTATLSAGVHTAYMVLTDVGGATWALIGPSTFTAPTGTIVNTGGTLEFRGVDYTRVDSISLQGGSLKATGDDSRWAGTVKLDSNATANIIDTQLTLRGVVSGTGALTKTGNGTLVLSGANTYSGATTVSAGTLAATVASALGTTAAGTTVASGAVLDLRNIAVGAEALTLNGGTLRASIGTSSLSGAVTLGAVSTVDVGGTQLTLSGLMTGTGGVTKNGTGKLELTAANTYSGGTTVNAGTLSLIDNQNTGTGVIVGSLTVNAGATVSLGGGESALGWNTNRVTTLNINGGTVTASAKQHIWSITNGINFNGGGQLLGNATNDPNGYFWEWGGTNVTVTNPTSEALITGRIRLRPDNTQPTFTVNGDGASFSGLRISAAITESSASGNITKAGAGTLTLSAANSYTGATTVNAGTLMVSGTLSDSTAISVANGATYSVGATDTVGSIAGAGNIVLGSGVTLTAGANSASTTYSGVMSGVGRFVKTGGGTLEFRGANTFTGDTVIDNGTLVLNSAGGPALVSASVVLGNGNANQPNLRTSRNNQFGPGVVLSSNNTWGNWGRFDLRGTNQTLAGMNSGTAAVSGAIVVQNIGLDNVGTTAGTLTFNGSGSYLFNGFMRDMDNSGVTYKLNLVKEGSGTQVIASSTSDVISYTGTTTVNAGTLQVGTGGAHSKLGNSSAATVNAGGTLKFYRNDTVNFNITNTLSGAGEVYLLGTNDGVSNNQSYYTPTANNSGFTGKYTVDRAQLLISTQSNLGATSATVNVLDKGMLTLNANGAQTLANRITLTGNGWGDGNGVHGALFSAPNGNWTLTGNITLAGNSRIGGWQDWSMTLSGVINDNNASNISQGYSLQKWGTGGSTGGTLTLTGANTYTGATLVNVGTLSVSSLANGGSASSIGAASNAAGNLLLSGGTLTYTGASVTTDRGFTIGAGTTGTINVGSASAELTIGGAANTTGALSKGGSGTLILGGANLYTGTTAVTAGTLQLGAGGTSGSLASTGTVTVSTGATFAFNRSDGLTVTNIIAGAGGVAQRGTGTTTLTASNTYTGNTTISAGTLELGGAGRLGSGSYAGTITNSGTLSVNTTAAQTLSGVISGAGSLLKASTGTLTLTGANTYTGGTTINAGNVITSGTLANNASATITINNGGTLTFGRTDVFGVHTVNVVTPIIINAGGTLTNNGSFFSRLSSVTLNGGTLTSVGGLSQSGLDGPIAWALAGDVTTNGDAQSTISGTGTVMLGSGTVIGTTFNVGSGTASSNLLISAKLVNGSANAWGTPNTSTLTKAGSGTLTLTGANLYTGATTISAGTLELGGGGTLGNGSYAGSIVNSGTLYVNTTAAQTLSGVISGAGVLNKANTGTLTLAGNNTYSGTTTISAGTLQVGGGGTTGTLGTANVVNNATLAFSRSDVFTVANDISGTGNVRVLDATGVLSSNALTAASPIKTVATNTTVYQVLTRLYGGQLSGTAVSLAAAGLYNARYDSQTQTATFQLQTFQDNYTKAVFVTLRQSGSDVTAEATGARYRSGNYLGSDMTDTSVTINMGLVGYYVARLDATGLASFTGSNTYSGTTTTTATTRVNTNIGEQNVQTTRGVLQLGNGGSSGWVGSGAIINDGAIIFNRSDNVSVANVISGSGSVAQASAATVTLPSVNTYTGNTTVLAGTLEVSGTGRLGNGNYSGTITIAPGGTFKANATGAQTLSGVISGGGALLKANTGTLTLTAANTFVGGTTVNAGNLTIGSGGSLANNASATITVNDGGTLNFGRTDTFGNHTVNVVAPITINAGGTVTNSGSFFNRLGPVTLNGGTLSSIGGASGYAWALAGGVTSSGDATSTISGTGSVMLGSNTTVGITITVGDGAASTDLLISAPLVNAAGTSNWTSLQTSTLTKAGAGQLVLSGTNTYSNTAVTGGTLQVGVDGASATSGTLGSGTVALSSGTTLTFNRSDTGLQVSGAISGAGVVRQFGSGTTTLSGTNTYTGTTTVSAGTLAITSAAGLGSTAAGTTVASGASLDLRNVTGVGEAVTLDGGTLRTSTGTSSLSGAVTLGANTTVDVGGTQLTVSGVISGVEMALTKSGTGTLVLSAANTYSGATTVSAGVLALTVATALGSTAAATTVASGAVLDLQNVTGVAEPVTLDGGTLRTSTGTSSLTGAVTFATNVTVEVGGTRLTVSGDIGGAGKALTKTGAGILELSGNNSYGTTTISAGTLAIGAGGETGTLGTGAVTNNSVLRFNRSTASGWTVANVISGTGSLEKQGSGVLALTAGNGYTGTTTISAGTLQVGDGGTSGSLGSGAVTNNSVLAFNRSNAVTVSNVISGTGSLAIKGGNTVTLTSNGSYTGATSIDSATTLVLQNNAPSTASSAFNGPGLLVIEPSGTSFTSALSTATLRSGGLVLGSTLGGLRLGKSGNTQAVTLGNALTIAGGLTVYGGAVTVNSAFASTGSGDILIEASGLTFGASGRLQSGGVLQIQPNVASTTIGVGDGAAGSFALPKSYFDTNFVTGFSRITVGNATHSGKITVGTVALNDSVTLQNSSGGIEVTGAFSAASGKTVILDSTGAMTDGTSGSISATNLALKNASAVTLDSASNSVGTLAASVNGAFTFVNNGALIVGAVNPTGITASGAIRITATGNLTVNENIATTNNSASAVVLVAGSGQPAGTAGGGDVIIAANKTITVGAGGTAKIFTGSTSGSTGVVTLVGSGSGRFRYNAIESTALATPIGAGLYAIYREQPAVTFSSANRTTPYGTSFDVSSNVNGLFGGDTTTTVVSSPRYSSSGRLNAGTYTVSVDVTKLANLGYNTAGLGNFQLTVQPLALTVTGVVVNDKVYDANTVGTVASRGTLNTVLPGDVVSIDSLSATFADANVGTNKVVTLSGVVLTGVDAANYSATSPGNTTGAITAASLTIRGATSNVTYSAGTQTNTYSVIGLQGSDTVTSVSGRATGITVGSYTDNLSAAVGTGLSNYAITYTNGSLTIGKANATVSGDTTSVTYNGVARTNTYTVTGVLGSDDLGVIGGATGTDAGVYVDNLSVTSAAAANYNVSFNLGSLTIGQKAATVVGNISTKEYNGSAQTSGYVINGVVSSDLTGSGLIVISGAASATHVAEGVVRDQFSVSGSKAGNYSFTFTAGSIQITPKTLMVTGQSSSSVYNKTARINAPAVVTGLVSGDTISITGYGSGTNVGTYVDNLAVTLANAADYALTISNGVLKITPATVTVNNIAANDKTYDGTATATVNGASATLLGVIGNDDVILNQGSLAGNFADKNVGVGKTVTVTGLSLAGGSAGNYQLSGGSTMTTTANISAKTLTVTGADASVTYNATTQYLAAPTVTGLVSGDDVTISGGASGINAGTYTSSYVKAGSDAGNYNLIANTATLTINKAALTITADNGGKSVGAIDPTLTYSTSGLRGADTLASIGVASRLSLSRASGVNVGTYDVTVSLTELFSPTNYNLTFQSGQFTIVPAGTLLVVMKPTTTTYGTAAAGIAQSVSYSPTAGGAAVTMTSSDGLTWTDNVSSSSITLTPALDNEVLNGSNLVSGVRGVKGVQTAVGSYSKAVTATYTGTSLNNFTGVTVVTNTLQVDPASLTITLPSDTRTYDATAYTTDKVGTIGVVGLKNSETLVGLGGVTLGGTALGSIDAGQYTLTGSVGSGFSNYTVTINNGTLTTNKAPLTVTGQSRTVTYNATAQTNSAPTVTGWQGNDLSSGGVSITGIASGTNAGSYTDSFALSGTLAGNYVIQASTAGTLTIDPAALTVSGAVNQRVYTGATQTNSGARITGLQGSDTLSVAGYAQAKDVAQDVVADVLTVTFSTGSLASNYSVTITNGSLKITPATVTVTGRSTSATYTGSEYTNTFTTTGLVGADTLTVTGSAKATDVQRTNGVVTSYADALQVTLPAGGNYVLGSVTNGSLTITPKAASLSGNVSTKVYNGSAQTSGYVLAGVVAGDVANIVISGAASATNVSQGVVQDNFSVGGTKAGNYDFTVKAGSIEITPAALTVSGTTVASKIYDTTRTATVTPGTLQGLVNSETLGLSASGLFDSANAGSRNVTVSYTLADGTGANAGLASNYTVTGTIHSVSITPKALTISGLSSANKVYDGTTAAPVSGTAVLQGDIAAITGSSSDGKPYTGDDVSLVGVATGTFNSKDVPNANSVSFGGLSLGGAQAGNYSLTAHTADTSARITPKTLGLDIAGTTKVYDGLTTITPGAVTLSGVVANDVVSLGAGSVTGYVDANVGTNKIVAYSGFALSGANASNYTLPTNPVSTASITPAALTVTASDATKTYDGQGYSGGNGVTYSGLVNSETAAVLTGTLTYSGNSQGAKNAGSYTITPGGLAGSNYTITFVDGALTINKANVTVTANSGTVTYTGQTQSISGFTTSPLAQGETAAVLTGVTTSGGSGKDVGSYTLTASGTDANYNLTFVDGTLTINKANLTLSGTRVYDGGTTFAGQYLTATGVNGETFAVTGSGDATNLASKMVASNQGVALSSVTGLALGASGNGGLSTNYNDLSIAGSSVTLTKLAATVSGTATSVTYNAQTQTQSAATSSGFLAGDTITISGEASGRNVGTYTSSLSVGGADAGNYTVTITNANLVIDKKAATVTAADSTATYTGQTQTQGAPTTSGFFAGDVITITGTASGKNAGTYTSSLSVSGGDAGNYDISITNANLVIDKANVTVTANSGTVTYTGQTQSISGFTTSPLAQGETAAVLTGVTTSGGSGKDVGSYTLTASGTDANYNLTFVDGTLTINKANLTLSGTRVYDGGTTFAGQYLTATGVNGETFAVTGSGDATNLASKMVASNQGVALSSVTGLVLGTSDNGGLSDNYNALSATGSSVTLTKLAATVTGTATSVTYNAQTQTQSAATSSGFLAGDTITISGEASGRNVGTYTSSLSVGGADAGNYTVTITNANLVIGKASATVTAQGGTVTYTGLTQTQSASITGGFFLGDSITITGEASGKNAGTYASSLSVSGGDAGNYDISITNANLVINKADAEVTAKSGTATYTGQTQSVSGFTATGLVNNETIAVLTGVTTGGGSGKNAGTYTHTASGTDANYNLTFVDGALTINKAPLTVTGSSSSTTYSGQTQSLSGYSVSGLVGSDTEADLINVSASGASGLNVGTYANTVSADPQTNYTVTLQNGTLTINKADLTLSGTRVYDGGKTFAGQYLTATGVNGETFTVTGAGDNSNLASIHVADNQGVALSSLTGLALGTSSNGGLDSNYNALSTTGSSVTLTKRTATVTGTAMTVSYNGQTQTQSAPTTSGFLAGDVVTIGGEASGKNAGTYTSNLSVTGAAVADYNVTITNADLTIERANLTLSGTRVYDGGTTFAGQYLTATGVNGETFTVTGAGDASNLASKMVASNQGVALSSVTGLVVGTSANGGKSENYNLLRTAGSSVTLTQLAATVTGTATSVTYNGQTQNQNAASSSGFLANDAVTISGAASGKNAGTYASSLSVSGADVGNYNISITNANLVINKANATVTANSGTVTYTGQTQSVSGFTATGLAAGETIAVLTGVTTSGGSGKDAGTYTHTASGTDANYTLAFVNGTLTINKANLTLSGTRTYDGGTTFAGQYLTATGVNGETFTVTGTGDATNLASKMVASNQGVALSSVAGLAVGTSANGGLSSNYNALATAGSNVTMTKRSATVTGSATSVIYNGLTQTQNAPTNVGLIATDALTISGVASGKNTGTYASSLSVSGADVGNYNISITNANLVINKANATVTANSGTVTYTGQTQSVSGFTATGLVAGETIAVLAGVTTSGGSGKDAGAYTHTASGTDTNYDLTFVNGTLTINKANLTLSGTRVYDGGTTFAGQYLTAKGVNGETFTVTGTGDATNLASKMVASNQGATLNSVAGLALGTSANGGLGANYNALSTTGSSVTLTKRDATVTANSGTVTYNGLTQTIRGFAATGLVAGETVAVLTGVTTSGGSGKNAGKYTHTASGTDANYNLTFVAGTLTIGKANAIVTANSETLTFNGLTQTIRGFTATGLVNGEGAEVLTGVTSSGGSGKSVGSYTHTVSGTDVNYELTFVDGTLTIKNPPVTAPLVQQLVAVQTPSVTPTPVPTPSVTPTPTTISTPSATPTPSPTTSSSTAPTPAPSNTAPAPSSSGSPASSSNGSSASPTQPAAAATPAATPSAASAPAPAASGSSSTTITPAVTGSVTPPETVQAASGASGPGFTGVLTFDTVPVATVGSFTLVLPDNTFTHSNAGTSVQISATTASGAPLPDWIKFSPTDRSFTGTPPEGVTSFSVVVVAVDANGNRVSTTLTFKFGD